MALGAAAGAALTYILLPMFFVIWLAFFAQEIPSFPPEGYSLKWFRAIPSNDRFFADRGAGCSILHDHDVALIEPFKVSYTAGQPYVGATLSMYPPIPGLLVFRPADAVETAPILLIIDASDDFDTALGVSYAYKLDGATTFSVSLAPCGTADELSGEFICHRSARLRDDRRRMISWCSGCCGRSLRAVQDGSRVPLSAG